MHLTLADLNGRILTRHLWFSFHVSKKPFNLFITLSANMKTVSFEVGGDEVLLTLLSVLLLLLLFIFIIITINIAIVAATVIVNFVSYF